MPGKQERSLAFVMARKLGRLLASVVAVVVVGVEGSGVSVVVGGLT